MPYTVEGDSETLPELFSEFAWTNPACVLIDQNDGSRYLLAKCDVRETKRYANISPRLLYTLFDIEGLPRAVKACNNLYMNSWGYVNGDIYRHILTVSGEDSTVDHINRIPADNRRCNLREASRSEQCFNRSSWAENRDITSPEHKYICETLNIQRLPRGVRWDEEEGKFHFRDHTITNFARRRNVPINTSGTKSSSVSLMNKFRSCLMEMIRAFDVLRSHGLSLPADEYDAVRERLATQYNEAVRAAHLHKPAIFPDGPYVDTQQYANVFDRECAVFKQLLDALPPLKPGESMGGPKELGSQYYYDEDLDAVACFRGDGTEGGPHPFVWDAKHHDVLKDLTIDRTDMRVHLTSELRARLGLQNWSGKKINVQDIVYHVLEGKPFIDGCVVVPFDQIRKDLRSKNIVYARGSGKNFKSTHSLVPEKPPVNIGYSYMPRGVEMHRLKDDRQGSKYDLTVKAEKSTLRTVDDDKQHDDGDEYERQSENKGKKPKITVREQDAHSRFVEHILPCLTAVDPEFEKKNERFQTYISEYCAIWERAKAVCNLSS